MNLGQRVRTVLPATLVAALAVLAAGAAPGAPAAGADPVLLEAIAKVQACGDVIPGPSCVSAEQAVPPAFSQTLTRTYSKNGLEHGRAFHAATVDAPGGIFATAVTRGRVSSAAKPGDPDGDDSPACCGRGTAELEIELSIGEPTTIWVEGFMQVTQVGRSCSDIFLAVDNVRRFEVGQGSDCASGVVGQRSISEEIALDTAGTHTIRFVANSRSSVTGSPSSATGFGQWELRFGVCSNEFTEGDDEINGTADDDVLCGGDGKDTINGGGGDDTIFGGPGDDSIEGGAGADVIDGGLGNDNLYSGSLVGGPDGAADTLSGGPGNDIVSALGDSGLHVLDGDEGRDLVLGGRNRDVIDGGPGHDSGTVGGHNRRLAGGPGNDLVRGGDGDDLLEGGPGSDELHGEAGSDKLRGHGGRDCLVGGARKDVLVGGADNDRLFARDGVRDEVRGGGGSDRARVDGNRDVVTGVESRNLSGSC